MIQHSRALFAVCAGVLMAPLVGTYGCAATPRAGAPTCATSSSTQVVTTRPSSSAPPAGYSDVYLTPNLGFGSTLCLNPQSTLLRTFAEAKRPELETQFDGHALAQDIQDLHAAMKKLYAGYPELLQLPDFDIEEYFAKWSAKVQSAAERAPGAQVAFGESIIRPLIELRKVHRDNHLMVEGWGSTLAAMPELAIVEYQTSLALKAEELASCIFLEQPPLPSTLRNATQLGASGLSSLTTYSAFDSGNITHATCANREVAFEKRAHSTFAQPKDGPVYEWESVGDTALISIRRLYGTQTEESVLSQLAADYSKHRTHKAIVFDLRGNGGGNDMFIYQWIAQAKRGDWGADLGFDVQLAGAEKPCGNWNNLVWRQLREKRVDTEASRTERTVYQTSERVRPRSSMPNVRSNMSDDHATHPYEGPIIVLVDHASASSAESSLLALASALGAIIVGERSGGYLEFGNLRPYVMARTGIVWLLPSKRNHYLTSMEGVGVPVSIYLSDDLLGAAAIDLAPTLTKYLLPVNGPAMRNPNTTPTQLAGY